MHIYSYWKSKLQGVEMRKIISKFTLALLLTINLASASDELLISKNMNETSINEKNTNKLISVNGKDYPFFVSYIAIPKSEIKAEIKSAFEKDLYAEYLVNYIKHNDSKIGVGIGFFETVNPPVHAGLLQFRKTVYKQKKNDIILDSIICTDNNNIIINSTYSLIENKYQNCVQLGPLLVWDSGTTRITSEKADSIEKKIKSRFYSEAYIRTFLGYDKDNYYVGSTTPATIRDLAIILKQSKEYNGLGLETAVNLTGSTPATILTKTDTTIKPLFGKKQYESEWPSALVIK